MIKKLIFLLILGGIAYVGYLVWTEHLNESEKTSIKEKLSTTSDTVQKSVNKVAKKAAKKTAEVVRSNLHQDAPEAENKEKEEITKNDEKETGN